MVQIPLPVALVPLSTVDYPSKLSCVLFFKGCNLNCTFCQNHELIDTSLRKTLSIENVLDSLVGRSFVDAVVLSGGEPTLYPNIHLFIKEMKDFYFKEKGVDLLVSLDTNGLRPRYVKSISKHVERFAIDLKVTDGNFNDVLRPKYNIEKYVDTVLKSISICLDEGKTVDVRTTYSPSFLSLDDLFFIVKKLMEIGFNGRYIIQRFSAQNIREEAMKYKEPLVNDLEIVKKKLSMIVDSNVIKIV